MPRPSPKMHASGHGFVPTDLGLHAYLEPLRCFFTDSSVKLFVEDVACEAATSRYNQGGITMVLGEVAGRPLCVVSTDFRVNGGAFGHAGSRRLAALLGYLERESIPCVLLLRTLGVSLMDGRGVFSDAFGIVPALLDYSRTNTLVTCAMGPCLGLGAILYALGHYRLAVRDKARLNLTGPMVLKLFFGVAFDFDRFAAAERQFWKTDLVHEMVDGIEGAAEVVRTLVLEDHERPCLARLEPRTMELVYLAGVPVREVFPERSKNLRVFVMQREGQLFGLFVTPPGRANLIDVRALETYAAGLDLFRSLGLPIVSMLDSPGIDPRFDQADRNIIRLVAGVAARIIDYPHGTMGVSIGRSFGGATTLAFPKVFGAQRVLALRGSRVGAMDPRLVERLLSNATRLLARWRRVEAEQKDDLSDLLANGTIDAVVDEDGLGVEVGRFVEAASVRETHGVVPLRKVAR